MIQLTDIELDRFWSKVDKTESCWIWLGATDRDGYGKLTLRISTRIAHRLCWEMLVGEIPDDIEVCHTCDNPQCVNPDHLFLGTRWDNAQDASNKGRLKSSRAKLSDEQVRHIRLLSKQGVSSRKIAASLGMGSSPILNVINRVTYKYVD